MNKKKIFKRLAISTGILSLLTALLVGNIVYAKTIKSKAEMIKEGKAFQFKVEKTVSDLAIKTFDIDTNKYKPVFSADLEKESTNVTEDIKTKVTAARVTLGMGDFLKIGDRMPVNFFGGNEVLLAIKHADGTISLIKYDVSKQDPIKTDQIDKEVK